MAPSAIDVVIPAHNAPPERLSRAVASARAVAGDGQVVVVDDGSDTPIDIDEPGVRVRRHQVALGPSAARNAGIEDTTTPWIALLDDDDELVADGVRAAMDLAERLDAGGVVVARDELHGDEVRPKPVPEEWADRVLPEPGDVFRPIRLFGATGVLVHRKLALAAPFDETLWIGEDRDFLRRVAARAPLAVSGTVALRMTIRQDGNLSSGAHMERRVRDHVTLLDRWYNEASAAHFAEATRWLLKRAARVGVSQDAWDSLIEAARVRGIATPVKARLRRWLGAGASS